jgi:ketosteroid isomerase-like protein
MSAIERETLMQTSREWAAAVAAGDLERALTYWTDDAIVLAPDAPAIVGKAAIREFVRQAASMPGFSITWRPELAVVSKDGDMAYMVEANRTTRNDATGRLQTQFGKAVTVWRRQADGTWKCVIDTWNANPTERVLTP